MSSGELIDDLLGVVIIDTEEGKFTLDTSGFLPELSALSFALRGGDWSATEYREARAINEVAAANAEGRGYDPCMSPAQVFAEKKHDEWQISRHDENLRQLRGER